MIILVNIQLNGMSLVNRVSCVTLLHSVVLPDTVKRQPCQYASVHPNLALYKASGPFEKFKKV